MTGIEVLAARRRRLLPRQRLIDRRALGAVRACRLASLTKVIAWPGTGPGRTRTLSKGDDMSTIAATLRPTAFPSVRLLRNDPAAQAFLLLRIGFTVAPILFGLDKFAEVMISDWPKYLAPEFNDLIPGSAQDAMYMVGAVEIAAGLVVAVIPRFGGLLVAGWLAGIIVSLLLVGGYGDIALRDFGLLIGALALSRLASAHVTEPR